MRSFLLALSAILMAASTAVAQGTQHTVHAHDGQRIPITLPPLTISGTTLDVAVSYDAARQVYRYEYSINAPVSNRAPVRAVQIDVSGRIARAQTDPELQENISRLGQDQPPTTIPVGISIPPAPFWNGGVGTAGRVFFSAYRAGAGVQPGSRVSGLVIESKLPPGPRAVEISPSGAAWDAVLDPLPEGEVEPAADTRIYNVKSTTIAPSDPDLSQLFNGGGQSPAEVNPFLRYVTPTDTRTKLAPGTTSTWVVVAYGVTTNAATFTASLNGADITSQFRPVPGALQAIQIALRPGSNKLQLSIEGQTSSGRTARDTDTLTFLVQ